MIAEERKCPPGCSAMISVNSWGGVLAKNQDGQADRESNFRKMNAPGWSDTWHLGDKSAEEAD